MGEGSSLEREKNFQRYQKGIGKGISQRTVSSLLWLQGVGCIKGGKKENLSFDEKKSTYMQF